MALEMKVHREINAIESKVMWGASWRQLAALALAIPIGGGIFAAIAFAANANGMSWADATSLAMYVTFPLLMPLAAWGWWRPKGLKPEQYFPFVLNHYLQKTVIPYDDALRADRAGKSVPERPSAPAGRPRPTGKAKAPSERP